MSEPVVQLFLDTFLVGLLPKDKDRITNDLTLSGTDGTSIVIKSNSNTIYKETPQKVFEAIPDKSILFLFHFPIGTLVNPDSTKFTTKDNSVYTFSTGDGVQKINDMYQKVVTEGTIQIKPPEEAVSGKSVASSIIDNAMIQESSLGDSEGLFSDLKDNPFYNLILVAFDIMKDIIIAVIFWLLFLSISCWLKVPAEFLYPTDTSKFPYRYFSEKDKGVKNYLKHTEDEMCEDIKEVTLNSMKVIQKKWFETIEEFKKNNPDKLEILKSIYPEMIRHEDKDVNQITTLLFNLCTKQPFGIMECVSYTMNILRFHSYISCTSVVSMIHSFCAVISNDILGKLVPFKIFGLPFISIIFAGFLYFLLLNTSAYTDQVTKMLNVKFSESKDIQSIMMNNMTNLIIYAITCCMLLFIPLFILFFMVSAGVTFYVLCNQLFDTFNGFILCIAAISLYFAMINYATLGLIVTGMMPLETVMEGTGGMFAGMSAIFSIFSVGIPLLTSFGYAGYIASKVFISAFDFISLEQISTTISRSITALVILFLFLLVMSVRVRLGDTYMIITIMIIILMGMIIASGNG